MSTFKLTGLMFCGAMVIGISGCTTAAAKKALNKPNEADNYSGFDKDAPKPTKRKAETVKPVAADEDPEKAIEKFVGHLTGDRAHAVSAEEHLILWGSRPGNAPIVASKVRMLLKHSNVEVRAPALRLTTRFGGPEANGDLIECLADSEQSIRAAAFKSLKARTHQDFGFNAGGGEIARAESVQQWRQWWQAESRGGAVQPASVYEQKPPTQPRVVKPGSE